MAERKGFISGEDSLRLSHALLLQGANIAKSYQGRFSFYFNEPRVQLFLRHAEDPEHLSDMGFVASSVVDYLVEKCPWPFIPKGQLEVRGFRDIPARGAIQFYARSLWLTWAESLDMVSVGPLLGLQAGEILYLLDGIRRLARDEAAEVIVNDRSLGQKIHIPFFSHGLQGWVVGLFHDISDEQKDPIHTTLLEFGQTLADLYAEMRLSRLATILASRISMEELAREAVNAFSPISKLIVEAPQGLVGYKLCHEHNYWAGYQQLTREEVQDHQSLGWFKLQCSPTIAIHIEPLSDTPNFDPDFFRSRLESGFRRFCGQFDGVATGDGLSIHEVQRRVRELEIYMNDGNPSYAKMRQYFVAQQIERDLQIGETRITNMRLKGFLEERTGKKARSGYQISSYIGDVERVFPNKLKAEKTRNGVSISWKLAT